MKKRYRKGIGKSAGKGLGRLFVAEVACPGIGNGISEEVMNGGEQDEERRVDMTINNQCNHAEAIAEDLYNIYLSSLSHRAPRETGWEDEPAYIRQAWYHVADQALPIIGKHALGDVRAYLGLKASGTSGWRKALYWAGGIILAGILAGAFVIFPGPAGENVPPVVQGEGK